MKRRDFLVAAGAVAPFAGLAGCTRDVDKTDWVETETTHEVEQEGGEYVVTVITTVWQEQGVLDGCAIDMEVGIDVDGPEVQNLVVERTIQRQRYYHDYGMDYTTTFRLDDFEKLTSRTDVYAVRECEG